MTTKIRKWGNSLGLRLPKSTAQEIALKDGSTVDVRVKNGEIVVRPVRASRYNLQQLLTQIRPENLHAGTDMGAPKGREFL